MPASSPTCSAPEPRNVGPAGILERMQTIDAPITVTDKAARKIAQLATKEGHAEPILRLRVVAGGCSGFSYELGFEERSEADDHVIAAPDGVQVLVDPKSAEIVAGSTLDMDTSMLGGGLKVHNPRAVQECACGESFAI
jgi:iron-sulfur cluster assembly accessory protein